MRGRGKHRINPYAYEVKIFDDIKILPGYVGVVTELTGDDVFSGVGNDLGTQNGFLVQPGRKGVLPQVLKEGTHRINPFLRSVALVNIQSQRHEFSGADAITFLTLDGFTVSLEGTVEFSLSAEQAPRLANEVGNMQDILKKLFWPWFTVLRGLRGVRRGRRKSSSAKSRQLFQAQWINFCVKTVKNGVWTSNPVLIRDIIVPQGIAEIIRQSRAAKTGSHKLGQQIERRVPRANCNRRCWPNRTSIKSRRKPALDLQNQRRTETVEETIAAETELKVANGPPENATGGAAASILKAAEAEKQIIAARNQSEADVLRSKFRRKAAATPIWAVC